MLSDVTAFATAASGVIGTEIAIMLADDGAPVAPTARSDGIHETAELVDAEDRALPVETDLVDESSVDAVVEETVEVFGEPDCVVNNAGIGGRYSPSSASTATSSYTPRM